MAKIEAPTCPKCGSALDWDDILGSRCSHCKAALSISRKIIIEKTPSQNSNIYIIGLFLKFLFNKHLHPINPWLKMA